MSEPAEVLRVGHEEHKILEPRQLLEGERCAFGGHELYLVKTEAGTFAVCDECPAVIPRAEVLT